MSEKPISIEEVLRRVRPEDTIALLEALGHSRVVGDVSPDQVHIVTTPGVMGGKPRIAGHRITVQNVAIWHERMGKSVDEIATEYDLTLAQIYAALSYYHDHRAEIEAVIREDTAFIEELKQQHPLIALLHEWANEDPEEQARAWQELKTELDSDREQMGMRKLFD